MVLLTYFLPIPEDRHNCAFVGSLIHGFFLAAGGWVAMMGHTAFKTITAGKLFFRNVCLRVRISVIFQGHVFSGFLPKLVSSSMVSFRCYRREASSLPLPVLGHHCHIHWSDIPGVHASPWHRSPVFHLMDKRGQGGIFRAPVRLLLSGRFLRVHRLL